MKRLIRLVEQLLGVIFLGAGLNGYVVLLVSEKYNFMDEVEQCASDPGKIALKWVNESSAVKKLHTGN